MKTFKTELSKKNKEIFQNKKIEFKYGNKLNHNEISEIISDKLLALIKKNVC